LIRVKLISRFLRVYGEEGIGPARSAWHFPLAYFAIGLLFACDVVAGQPFIRNMKAENWTGRSVPRST
jgi:hypothetical protein